MNDIQKFTFYRNYYDLIKELKGSDRAKFLEAIVYYIFEDKEPNFKGLNLSIWQIIKVALDTSKNRSNNHKKNNSNEIQKDFKVNSNKIQNNFNEAISISTSTSYLNNNINNNLDIKENRKEINKEKTKENLFTFIEEVFGRTLSPVEYELVSKWEDNEITRYAIKQTSLSRATSLKYTQRILDSYKAKGFKTISEIETDEKRFQENKKERNKSQLEKSREAIERFRNGKK